MTVSLKTLAIAAAILLPVASAAAGAVLTLGAGDALAAKDRFERIKPHAHRQHRRLQRHVQRHTQRRDPMQLRRCLYPTRTLIASARRIMARQGYRQVRHSGYYTRGCYQNILFIACRGNRTYRVIVRYSFGRYHSLVPRRFADCRK